MSRDIELQNILVAFGRAYHHAQPSAVGALREARKTTDVIQSRENKKLQIVELKKDIKYHTLKARYQRMYLGGDEDALPTKRYVKKLKARLAKLEQGEA